MMNKQFSRTTKKINQGFTLIEVLLVMIVVSMFIYMGIGYVQQKALVRRLDLTTLQMQQILNAGLSYYVANGNWPVSVVSDLSTLNAGAVAYLAPGTLNTSPWATSYSITSNNSLFYTWVAVTTANQSTANSYAKMIASRLPSGYIANAVPALGGTTVPTAVTDCSSSTCYVVTSVTIPGQNTQNASNVNFAGLYHHGACVPVPSCPVDASGNTMTPQVMVVPVSVSGLYTNSTDVYPISSFTGYAVGPDANPGPCVSGGGAPSCTVDISGPPAASSWRVCLQIVTEQGTVTSSSSGWGEKVTLLAITRCSISNEPAGSTFSVYTN